MTTHTAFVYLDPNEAIFYAATKTEGFEPVVGYIGDVCGIPVGLSVNDTDGDLTVSIIELQTGTLISRGRTTDDALDAVQSADDAHAFYYRFAVKLKKSISDQNIIELNQLAAEGPPAPLPEAVTKAKLKAYFDYDEDDEDDEDKGKGDDRDQ